MAKVGIIFYFNNYASPEDCARDFIKESEDKEAKFVMFRLATIDDYESIRGRAAPEHVIRTIENRRCFMFMY